METPRIFAHGKIYTMARDLGVVQAMAVAAGTIQAVGATRDLQAAWPQAHVTTLPGQAVIPGFADSHMHFLAWARRHMQVDLAGCTSARDGAIRVAEFAARHPDMPAIIGVGWLREGWPGRAWPTRHDLDAFLPDRPVALWSKDGHTAWLNSLALQRRGISSLTEDPPGGRIEREDDGATPTGLLHEAAAGIGMRGTDLGDDPVLTIREAQAEAHSLGIVAVHDFGEANSFSAFQVLRSHGDLGLRVLSYLPVSELDTVIRSGLRSRFGDVWHRFGGIKLFVDGSLGSRTAALFEPYSDEPDNLGTLVMSPDEVTEVVRRASAAGITCAIHAIGDRANSIALDAIAEAGPVVGGASDLHHRIEHAQLVDPDDINRFAHLGVIASVQPAHLIGDAPLAEQAWGDRCEHAYPYHSLFTARVRLACGSDAPFDVADPLLGLYAAVMRRGPGDVREGFVFDERLPLPAALSAYGTGPAYIGGDARVRGRLAPGMLADFVVVSTDPFRAGPTALQTARVLGTYLGGRCVFSAPPQRARTGSPPRRRPVFQTGRERSTDAGHSLEW